MKRDRRGEGDQSGEGRDVTACERQLHGGGPYFFNPGSMAVARLKYFWAFLASPFCS